MNDEINKLRREYRAGVDLDVKTVASDPLAQFRGWFDEALAADPDEPNAMTLATATKDGRPSARTVLLKEYDEAGFVFYTNYTSRKGSELEENPYAALLFYWPKLERQVRIEGGVTKVSVEQSDKYFASRPTGSQLGAAISPQSRVIDGHELAEKFKAAESSLQGRKVERPAHWGGYRLQPVRYEFWQGRENRLHDRIEYNFESGVWTLQRLAP